MRVRSLVRQGVGVGCAEFSLRCGLGHFSAVVMSSGGGVTDASVRAASHPSGAVSHEDMEGGEPSVLRSPIVS
jgi:hypothetical protein